MISEKKKSHLSHIAKFLADRLQNFFMNNVFCKMQLMFIPRLIFVLFNLNWFVRYQHLQ